MSDTEEETTIISRILKTTNFYDILKVPSNATKDQIKSAFKTVVLQVHPDKNLAPKAKDAFIAARNATAILLDKNKRREYDEHLRSPSGRSPYKFNLSDDTVNAIFMAAGINGILGGITALCDWLFIDGGLFDDKI